MKTCFRCQEPEHICECDDPIFTKKKYIEALEASLVKDGEALSVLHAENEALKELNEKLKYNRKWLMRRAESSKVESILLKEYNNKLLESNERLVWVGNGIEDKNKDLKIRLDKAVDKGLEAQDIVREQEITILDLHNRLDEGETENEVLKGEVAESRRLLYKFKEYNLKKISNIAD